MRVLFIVDNAALNGGTEILARNLAGAFGEAGMECKLVSAVDCRRKGSLKRVLEKLAAEYHADWIVNHTYDICHEIPTGGPWKTAQVFNWSVRGYENSVLKIIASKPILMRIPSRILFEFKRWRWHRALAKFTKLVVLTDAAKPEVVAVNSNIRAEQLTTIPDPIMRKSDSEGVSSLKNKQVVFVGRLSAEKGVMRLLRIWEKVHEQLPEYKLNIYGEGHMREAMTTWLREMKERGEGEELRVEFKGFEKDLEKLYTGSDLLLMTSDTEGFGMVLIEAMYYGVPCISFDCPISPKEIIGATGVAVPCFDEDAYARAVIDLLKAPARLQELQSAAIWRARDFYIDEVMRKWKYCLGGCAE